MIVAVVSVRIIFSFLISPVAYSSSNWQKPRHELKGNEKCACKEGRWMEGGTSDI